MKHLILLFSFIFSICIFGQKSYLNKLGSKSDFSMLQGKPLVDKFSNMKSVKIVYDYSTKKLYFINSKKFEYHNEFCREILGYPGDLAEFNKENYNADTKRKYLLANINYLEDSEDWILELAASDQMNAKFIDILYNEVVKNTFFNDKLKFYLNSPHVISLYEKKQIKSPSVYSDFLFKRISEQLIERGNAVGILKKYDLKNNEAFLPNPNEIIVINTTPNYIPEVKGVIVTDLQTPLSHLVLLAKNRNIPVYVDTKIWDKKNINNLIGKKVELIVRTDNYLVKETKKEISVKKTPKITLKKDITVKNLVDLEKNVPNSISSSIGYKATNLALLKIIQKEMKNFITPEYAFAIPFYYYDEHMKNPEILSVIQELYTIPKDSAKLKEITLTKLRKTIKKVKVNPDLIKLVEDRINSQSEFTNFRFRSSTNAEDTAGFNGAGLYDSKTAILGDPKKTVEKAILEVWSSFWNYRAYIERELFGINHESCAMGVLVHRSFPDENSNGVLITKNIYRSKYSGITVNVQAGEESVVKPMPNVTCDEFYCHNFNGFGDLVVDYRSSSSINNGKPVLSKTQISKLFKISSVLEYMLNKEWQKRKMTKSFYFLDVEFKFVGDDNKLYIKQARAYMD